MSDKIAICKRCSAWADVDGNGVSWNMSDIELCKHTPINKCLEMRAALKDPRPKM